MPKRVRLTQRRNREAVDGSIPYPGNVNQPDRKFKEWDQYHTFEQSVNHELPDMRHDWKNDERDDIGFGIPEPWGQSPTAPTVASVRVAANKAVKLAYFLLGNKVAEEVIEDQANDFMLLGPEAIDRTLGRFAETGELYAQNEDDDAEEDDDEGEGKEASTEEAPVEESKEAAAKKAEDDKDEDKDEGESKDKDEGESKEAAADEKAEDEDKDKDEGESKEAAADEKKAEDDEDEGDEDDEGDSKEASNGLDIELGPVASDEEPEADERLASLFDDDIPAELPEPGAGRREASEKKGVKSLGGQPRVAGNGGESQDISSIWDDAPDVSEVFQ